MSLLKSGTMVFGRYRVEEFVGEGGMQEVYRATDLALDRIVALKTPKNDHAAKRFQRSAIVSAKVRHPSVATTLDYFESNDRAYLIEEFITGVDLKRVMQEHYSHLDPALVAHLATHLAKGLAACHAEEIWHRDLKPANIMISDPVMFTEVKITDFGIAKMIEEEFKDDVQSSITGSQTLLGALPYMAPECLAAPKKANMAADIWSFGAIVYSLICGTLPFGSNLGTAVPAIMTGKYPPPPTWMLAKTQFRSVFDGLWAIVQKCLVVEAEQRPSASELVAALAGVCFSVYPRIEGVTSAKILKGGSSSFVLTGELGDVFYHIDSHYKESGVVAGETVVLSAHEGVPSPRAFPLLVVKTPFA